MNPGDSRLTCRPPAQPDRAMPRVSSVVLFASAIPNSPAALSWIFESEISSLRRVLLKYLLVGTEKRRYVHGP